MELSTEDGTALRDPGAEQIAAALVRLGLPGNGFAILSTAEQHYIQAAGSRADGFVVEYREGDEATHHGSVRADIPHAQLVELFTAYRQGRPWKSMIQWHEGFGRREAHGGARAASVGHRILLMLFFGIGVVALCAAGYFAFGTWQLLQKGVEAKGTVTKMVSRGSSYSPIVEYVDHSGEPQRLESRQSSRPASFFKGERVTVVYDPSDPRFPVNARIKSFGELWGMSLFFVVFGGMFAGVATIHWIVLFRRSARAR